MTHEAEARTGRETPCYEFTENGSFAPFECVSLPVGTSRGGALAMNIDSGEVKLVLLCPAWKNWGTARTEKPDSVILHSRADDVIPFADFEELARNSSAKLIEIGNDHRLADPDPLAAMLKACEGAA